MTLKIRITSSVPLTCLEERSVCSSRTQTDHH